MSLTVCNEFGFDLRFCTYEMCEAQGSISLIYTFLRYSYVYVFVFDSACDK